MKCLNHLAFLVVIGVATPPIAVQAAADVATHQSGSIRPDERLGAVSFPVSCSPSVRASFNRGVALLHDFWYDEARPQFEAIAKSDPSCSMAHWGIAMSVFHQIWDRPDEVTIAQGWREIQAAQSRPPKTTREREYIATLSDFFHPGQDRDYQARIDAYSAAMAKLYDHYPHDIDAGAFYALSLLAAEGPTDTSLSQEHKAMAVLKPLFLRYPDHPGVVHYIIHACDTPSLAADGLTAAEHYGEIAGSAPHAAHMPGHIFARLGMWREDIDANLASVAQSKAAEARHESGVLDQFHSDDFLLYAYLQSGQDAKARALVVDSAAVLAHFEAMPNMADHYMPGMFANYRAKYPIFLALEFRDWKSAAAIEPIRTALPENQTLTYWARVVANGHLRNAEQARADLAEYDSLMERIRQGPHRYYADSNGAQIMRNEMLAWAAFAQGNDAESLKQMRASADLQDKVGQGEVDIPAREMLADILLELNQPKEALMEYQQSLKLSPNRFNGMFNAGMAAEAAGDKTQAAAYYAALLKSTDNGSQSTRPEIEHARNFTSDLGSQRSDARSLLYH